MTTIETALCGWVAAVAVAGLGRRLPIAAIVAAVTGVYFALAPAWDARHGLVMALCVGWAGFCMVRGDSGPRDSGLKRATLGFLGAAPMLAVMAEPASELQVWDGLGLLLFASGLTLSLAGPARLNRWRVREGLGEVLMAWAFYGFALAVSSGAVTVFAPLLLTQSLLAPGASKETPSYGLSDTHGPAS